MAIYYRATTAPMPVGDNPGTKAYNFSDDRERQTLEDFLEKRRPSESHSRLSSWFACDSPERAVRYLEAQLKHENKPGAVVVFAVEMPFPSRQPMALIDAILAALREQDTDKADFLAQEYWRPRQAWKFWEYTSAEVSVVVEQVKNVDLDEMAGYVAHQDYTADHDRVKTLVAEWRKTTSKA